MWLREACRLAPPKCPHFLLNLCPRAPASTSSTSAAGDTRQRGRADLPPRFGHRRRISFVHEVRPQRPCVSLPADWDRPCRSSKTAPLLTCCAIPRPVTFIRALLSGSCCAWAGVIDVWRRRSERGGVVGKTRLSATRPRRSRRPATRRVRGVSNFRALQTSVKWSTRIFGDGR